MANYPSAFFHCVDVFNSYEKQCVFEWNSICLDEDEEKNFRGFSAEAENTMAGDNLDFATYLYNNCKPFKRNLASYTDEEIKDIYCGFYASRFNCDCFSFKGFSEIENTFIERFIDRNFAIERQFEVNSFNVACISYYAKTVLHNWEYVINYSYLNNKKWHDMRAVFKTMNYLGFRYYDTEYRHNEFVYYFYEKGLTVKHNCKLTKAIEKEYGKYRTNMPCIVEIDAD